MALFETRVQYSKLTFSPISSEDMATIAGIVLDHIKERIQKVVDDEDNPARPLKPAYAAGKVKGRRVALTGGQLYRGKPVRDWTLRGRTLQSLKVKTVSQDHAVIGPVSEEAAEIIAVRNRLDHMWGLSPSDTEVMYQAVFDTLFQKSFIRFEKTGQETKVA